MATIEAVSTKPQKNVLKVLWEAMASGDTGSGEGVSRWPDRSVQALGTFGTGTVIMEGSNDGGTTYFALTDPQGNAISFSAAGGEAISENPLLVRPRTSVGATGMDVDVYLTGVA